MAVLKRASITLNGRRYEDIAFVERGGSGEVYKAQWDKRSIAIKLFLPFHEAQQLSLLGTTVPPELLSQSMEFQEREYGFISGISHPGIVIAFDAGRLKLTKREQQAVSNELGVEEVEFLPVLITEYIDGLRLDKAISEYGFSADKVADCLRRIAQALDFLHVKHEYMHVDVKAANVLVRKETHEPVLIDFALAKNLNFQEVDRNEVTKLLGDWGLFPQLDDGHPLKRIKEGHPATRDSIRAEAFPYLDLFQFGKLLEALQSTCAERLEAREMGYLADLTVRLTDWDALHEWTPGQLADRISRLSPERATPFGIEELTVPGAADRTIILPLAGGIPVTTIAQGVINTRSFRRLSLINQLSLLGLVYPAADYKRSVHVLYSYELTRQLVAHLYSSPEFRYHFDPNTVRQMLLVSLLHDINHFPFLHILQESGVAAIDRLKVFDMLCDGDATGEKAAGSPSVYELLESIGVDRERFKRIVHDPHGQQSGDHAVVDQVISSVVNSGVDVDKLSYLTLDAYFTGVSYGSGLDIGALLKGSTIARTNTGALHLSFTDRAIAALEDVVMTRYWNFRTIYWHHTNRAVMAMLLQVVRRLYADNGESSQYIYDTLWMSDYEALRYLDTQYASRFGRESMVHDLEKDRGRIFRRLYTLHPQTDTTDRDLYKVISKPAFSGERFRGFMATGLNEHLGDVLQGRSITQDDVLFDVPRRQLDSGGDVYITDSGTGQTEPLARLSEPVRFLVENYNALAQRVRIFVAPWLAQTVGRRKRIDDRDKFQAIISAATKATSDPSEVR